MSGSAWPVVVLIGGMAAPLFLFLAGVSVPLAIAAYVSRGKTMQQAAWLVQRRGWEVFLIAHLFRLQSFLTNPHAQWSSILKPDILNILGLGLAGTAWLAGRVRTPKDRIWWLLVPAVIVLLLTPWAKVWWWPTLLHPRLEAYVRPWVATACSNCFRGWPSCPWARSWARSSRRCVIRLPTFACIGSSPCGALLPWCWATVCSSSRCRSRSPGRSSRGRSF